MGWFDDLIGIGSGATSTLSPEELVSAGADSLWMPSVDTASSYLPSWFDNVAPLLPSSSGSSDFYGLGSTGGLSGPEEYFAGRDEVWLPAANSSEPSAWDSFNNGLQKIGNFTSSKGGQFLMGGLGGLAAYLDAKKKNALMKQMMEQAAAEKAAKAAKAAQYDAPSRVTNAKMALPTWGAGTPAFSGNSLKAMTPRSTSTMYAAKGGSTGGSGVSEAHSGYVPGSSPGQSDKVPAMLSDGEFVVDADTVSALGDGNNAAGASALEQMRQNIRRHKRAAPAHKIPPKAKKPEAYLKGAK